MNGKNEEERIKFKEKMLEEFERFIDFYLKEEEYCPWVNEIGIEELLDRIKGELEEVKEEIEKGEKEKLIEEVGDVFRGSFLLLVKSSYNIGENPHIVIKRVLEKIKRRKPWVIEERKVSLKESLEIWQQKKEEEKNFRGNSKKE